MGIGRPLVSGSEDEVETTTGMASTEGGSTEEDPVTAAAPEATGPAVAAIAAVPWLNVMVATVAAVALLALASPPTRAGAIGRGGLDVGTGIMTGIIIPIGIPTMPPIGIMTGIIIPIPIPICGGIPIGPIAGIPIGPIAGMPIGVSIGVPTAAPPGAGYGAGYPPYPLSSWMAQQVTV